MKINTDPKLSNPDLYRIAISQIVDYGIFMLDPQGIVCSWNPGAERLKGYTADEIIGKHFSVFYTEEDMESFKPVYELNVAIQDGRFEDEGWRVRKDGSRFWANVIITPIFVEEELIGFSKISRDLTQRKMTEEVIRESNDKYKLLLEQTRDYALFLLDAKGRVASWNIGAERIKGYKAEEIIGKHFSRFYTEEAKRTKYPDYELRVAGVEGRFEDVGWRVRKDGTRFWANVIITALHRENKLVGFSKLTRDITEKKRAEDEAAKKNEIEALLSKTKQINEELSRFAHIVAHDLRAPLRAIGNYTQFLEAANQKSDMTQQGSFVEKIRENVSKMNHLIDGILAYAEAGGNVTETERVDIKELMMNLPAVINLPGKVKLKLEEPLPVVDSSSLLLRQILENLLTNAVKYNDKPKQLIVFGCHDRQKEWEFYLSDNGIGIEEKYFGKIFGIFETLGGKTENSAGIGLSIVKKAVEAVGGRIWLESAVGKGTTFFFTIPKRAADTTAR